MKFILEIKDQEVVLTEEEAENLYEELRKYFKKNVILKQTEFQPIDSTNKPWWLERQIYW